jgi:uncharacterized membrane protein (TIGR02234 family)
MPDREPDRFFGPAVLIGVGGAALAAVAASRSWAETSGTAAGVRVTESVDGSEAAPLALALSLVALAAWGVLLVLRGRSRQVAAALATLAALGVVWAFATAGAPLQDAAVRAVQASGAVGEDPVVDSSGWYWTTGVAAVLTAVASAVAMVRARRWPTMGSRYDAPATRARAGGEERDLWRAMDEGHDPTA